MSAVSAMQPDSGIGIGHRAFALDAATIALCSAVIAAAAQQLGFMTVVVPAVMAGRMLLWALLPRAEHEHGLGRELLLMAVLTVLGGFNDFNSVVRHRVYDYTVPSDLSWSMIPAWMLLYWGMIVRFMVSVVRWRLWNPPARPSDLLRVPGTSWQLSRPWLKAGFLLMLVVLTRQAIYRWYLDPILSWLPFALALGLHLLLVPWGGRQVKMLALTALLGPLAEVLYIQLGQLHWYHLGWIGGVPLWICLWWLLAVLVLDDLVPRVLRR